MKRGRGKRPLVNQYLSEKMKTCLMLRFGWTAPVRLGALSESRSILLLAILGLSNPWHLFQQFKWPLLVQGTCFFVTSVDLSENTFKLHNFLIPNVVPHLKHRTVSRGLSCGGDESSVLPGFHNGFLILPLQCKPRCANRSFAFLGTRRKCLAAQAWGCGSPAEVGILIFAWLV